ncbi:hypothetical protein GT713_00330 [Clostridium beijerinckii]|uniref:hypothetical protein n=1 Tax=Clostridium beijerinckii TaxID=1520 RepID=UPI00136144AD|nr:hypothetical protein [Clostridium beijerinckii]MZK96588.1 hypothetical protein [Clostridium beijerinckii]
MIRGEIKIELKREKTFVKSRWLCNFYYKVGLIAMVIFSINVGGILSLHHISLV